MNLTLGPLCLGLYLLLTGLELLNVFSVSNTIMGILAFIAGIVILVDAWHPIVVRRPVNTTQP